MSDDREGSLESTLESLPPWAAVILAAIWELEDGHASIAAIWRGESLS